jgi:hypothetical protein
MSISSASRRRNIGYKSHSEQSLGHPLSRHIRNWKSTGLKAAIFCACVAFSISALAGGPPDQASYKVLPAIQRKNLAIFPVVIGRSYDASQFLTLDEGIRSGQVIISESRDQPALIHPGQIMPQRRQGAEVNRLVLYNNSTNPYCCLLERS